MKLVCVQCSINKKQTRDSISYEGKIQHAETSKYLHYIRSPQVNPRLSENDIPCKFKNPIGCQMATYLAEGWHTAASKGQIISKANLEVFI